LTISAWAYDGSYNRNYFPQYKMDAFVCKQADTADGQRYMMAKWRPGLTSPWPGVPPCVRATLGMVDWYNNSECAGNAVASMMVFTDGDINRGGGCRDALGNPLPVGSQCQGHWSTSV